MCKHRTRFEPRYGETDAGKNEPYRVWQTHAPGDDRDENSYAEEANGVSENGVHDFNYSAIGQSAVYFPPALLLTAENIAHSHFLQHHFTATQMLARRTASGKWSGQLFRFYTQMGCSPGDSQFELRVKFLSKLVERNQCFLLITRRRWRLCDSRYSH